MPNFDVLCSPSGGTQPVTSQSWGTVICGAPRGSNNQMGVSNRANTLNSSVAGGYAADPSGVVNKYTRRFKHEQFYTA